MRQSGKYPDSFPVFTVGVSVSEQASTTAMSVSALLDTGSNVCLASSSLLKKVGAHPTANYGSDIVTMSGHFNAHQYHLCIDLAPHEPTILRKHWRVYETAGSLLGGHDLLLGSNFLRAGRLSIDGSNERWSFEIDEEDWAEFEWVQTNLALPGPDQT